MTSRTLLVLTTCGSAESASALARYVVEQRLAACVNCVDGITSTYRWDDGVVQDQESLLLIKTTETLWPALQAALRERSSYELPEVLAIEIYAGSHPYLTWLRESVEPAKD